MANRDIRMISFRVAGEAFVLDIMAVRQIVPYSGSTPVPRAPGFIEGIVVLRNEVIPILDLRERLYPASKATSSEPLVLITGSDEGLIGLKVDEVRRILTVATDSILPPPPIVRGLDGDLFIGVIEIQNDIHLLLDLQSILSAEEKRTLSSSRVRDAMQELSDEAIRV